MQNQQIDLSPNSWTEVLSDGGTLLFQGGVGPIFVLFYDTATPPLEAEGAFHLEPHQTRDIEGLKLPAGQRLFMRAAEMATTVRIAK